MWSFHTPMVDDAKELPLTHVEINILKHSAARP